jgi:hypothetical protein
MADPVVVSRNRPDLRLAAPAWHTVVLLLVLLALSGMGAYTHRAPGLGQRRGHVVGYLIVIASEWLLLAFVWFGMRRYGVRLTDPIGGNWSRWKAIARDLVIAAGFLLASNIVLELRALLLHAVPNQAIRNLLPYTEASRSRYIYCWS